MYYRFDLNWEIKYPEKSKIIRGYLKLHHPSWFNTTEHWDIAPTVDLYFD